MKRIILFCVAIAASLSILGCQKETQLVVKVTTLDATEVSMDGYTFNAEVEIKGLNLDSYAEMGVYYGHTPNVSKENKYLTTAVKEAKNGHNAYSERDKNGDTIMLNRVYYFNKGETLYYKAYVKVIDANGVNYHYGEEKSFVLN